MRKLPVIECPHIMSSDSRVREVPMWRRPAVAILILVIPIVLTLPLKAQQKPFTQDQISKMVQARSEERCVGKECRSRGSPYH